MKKIIYTALFGNYDNWHEPDFVNTDWKYILFTDQDITSKVYQVIKIKGDVLKAREIKLLPHRFLPDYDICFWHDASIIQRSNINEIIKKERVWDMIIMEHGQRSCLYAEAEECIKRGKGNKTKIMNQINRYRQEKIPENTGLVASGLMIRKNNYRVRLFCEKWWNELKNESIRDQISFSYTLYNHNKIKDKAILIKKMPYTIRKTLFQHRLHRNERTELIRNILS